MDRFNMALPEESILQRASRLRTLNIDVLICGAISRPLVDMITGSGIEVLPYVSGRIDEVLNAYMEGRLTEQRFSMPGCRTRESKAFRCRGRGRGRDRGYGRRTGHRES